MNITTIRPSNNTETIVTIEPRDHWDQMQQTLPAFLSLYKPFEQSAALGGGLLRLICTVTAYRSQSTQASGWNTQIQLLTRTLVATTAVVGTFFAHPVGLCISTAYDLIEESQALYHHVQKGNYANTLQSASKVMSDSLYLLALLSGSMQWTIGALTMQVFLGLNAARQALAEKNYIEALTHLTLIAVRSYQIAGLAQTATTQQEEAVTSNKEAQLQHHSKKNATQCEQANDANTICIDKDTIDRLLSKLVNNSVDTNSICAEISHILDENKKGTAASLIQSCIERFRETRPSPQTPSFEAMINSLPSYQSTDTPSDLFYDFQRMQAAGHDIDPNVAQWVEWVAQYNRLWSLSAVFSSYL